MIPHVTYWLESLHAIAEVPKARCVCVCVLCLLCVYWFRVVVLCSKSFSSLRSLETFGAQTKSGFVLTLLFLSLSLCDVPSGQLSPDGPVRVSQPHHISILFVRACGQCGTSRCGCGRSLSHFLIIAPTAI